MNINNLNKIWNREGNSKKMNLGVKLIFLAFLASCLSLEEADQTAFQAIYDSLGGASWTNQPSLDDLCTFEVGNIFVKCDDNSERIVQMYSFSNNFYSFRNFIFFSSIDLFLQIIWLESFQMSFHKWPH